MNTNKTTELSRQQIRERIGDLGRWFHNLDLRGVRDAHGWPG